MTRIAATFITVSLGALLTTVSASEVTFKTRAIWVPPSSFESAASADEMIARCQRAGFNLIIANVMSHQSVAFRSGHFRGRVAANDQFDPLAYLVQKCRAADIRIQAWSCVYYEGARRDPGGSLQPDWLVRSMVGQPFHQHFFAPGHPEVNPYLLSVLKELLAYDIDGIHLDYIRYPGGAFDYSTAVRKAFENQKGFDPQDFLDHPERIVPPDAEPFPIRVLQPHAHTERVWETTAIERTLDQAGLGHAFISESSERIAQLHAPGLLILASYYTVPPDMLSALEEFVVRGGTILWTDVPAAGLKASPALRRLTGLASAHWMGKARLRIEAAGDHPLGSHMVSKPFCTESLYDAASLGAQVIAKRADGTPAAFLNEIGKGRVIVLAFHLMKSTSPEVAGLARRIADWCEAEAGVAVRNPLAAKRAEWFTWRGEQVTQLVRDLSTAAKQKNPALAISSSGGPSPFEFFACYRDARRWLLEGINDEVYPMNYTEDPMELAEMLELQTASAPPGTVRRIFPGLQIYSARTKNGKREVTSQRAAIVEQQLQIVRQHGYEGFCLFAYNHLNNELIEVVKKFSVPVR